MKVGGDVNINSAGRFDVAAGADAAMVVADDAKVNIGESLEVLAVHGVSLSARDFELIVPGTISASTNVLDLRVDGKLAAIVDQSIAMSASSTSISAATKPTLLLGKPSPSQQQI